MTDSRLKPEWLVERQGKQAVLYAGLLSLGHDEGLKGISTNLVQIPSELNGMTAIVHATVETAKGTFQGIGDANPTNVTRMIVPHLIRMAETRAKARALRDAVNIGLVTLEELGGDEDASQTHEDDSRGASPRRAVGAPVSARPSASTDEIARLRETYRIRTGEAIALGIAVDPLPKDADRNTILDMGIVLRDKLAEKRAEIDAQRRGR